MKRKFFAAFLSLCMVMSLVPMTALAAEGNVSYVSDAESLVSAANESGTIQLEQNISLNNNLNIAQDVDVTLDLNGHNLDLASYSITVSGNLTVKDSSIGTTVPTVSEDGNYTVTYDSGKITSTGSVVITQNNGIFTLESGSIESGDCALCAGSGSTTSGTVNVYGGYVLAQEFGVLTAKDSTANIYGGVIETKDNAVLGGNGTAGQGGYTINVYDGTLIGRITTADYVSCGIYHPNEGSVNVSGGTIISTSGAGIVARAGQTNVTGGTIIALGKADLTGKVGDSRIVVPTSGIVLDLAARYPGAGIEDTVATNADVYVSGEATISGTNSSIDVIDNEDSLDSGVIEQDNVIITGGTFTRLTNGPSSPDLSAGEFFPTGALLTQDTTGKVIASEPEGGKPAVAEVNGVPYTSLQSAIDMARDGDEVTLLKNTEENITIEEGQNLVLDLNGYTLDGGTTAGTAALTNNGTATIKDSSAAQTGTIKRSDNGPTGCYYTIENNGTMTIASGNVCNNAGSETTWSGSSLICNGRTSEATLNITGGNISQDNFIAVKNDENGTLTITGGTISSKAQAVQNWKDAKISGGTMTGAVTTWAYSNVAGTTTISGNAYINGDVGSYWYNKESGLGATLIPTTNINGGTILGNLMKAETEDGNGSTPVDPTNNQGNILVKGGTFAEPVEKTYLDTSLTAELYSMNNTVAPYSYYASVAAAQAAAQSGDVVTDLSTVAENAKEFIVVFDYGDGTKKELTMPEGANASLPSLNDRGYNHFVGWTDQAGKHYDGGDTVTITANTTFTAQWSYIPPANPNYRITIGDMENGTVTANPTAAKAGATVTLTPVPDEDYALSTLTVTDRFGDAVRVTEQADGTYTFPMPNGQVTVNATFVETEEPVAEPFIDVAEGDWFYDAVVYAYQNELMDGVGGNRFAPNSETTRAQLVTILYRLEGEPAVSGDLPFTDVEAGIWYTDAILWAAQNNIVNGVSDTEFAPGDDLTRQQLVTILYRYAEAKGYDVSASADLSGYPDADQVQDYAQPAMAWAVAENIIQGMEDGTLKPAGNASRAQIATILMRFCEDVAQ